MFAAVLFALVLLAILAFWAFGRGGNPDTDVQVESGLGAEVEAPEVEGLAADGPEPDAVTVVPEQ
jgi:hypothetical protein